MTTRAVLGQEGEEWGRERPHRTNNRVCNLDRGIQAGWLSCTRSCCIRARPINRECRRGIIQVYFTFLLVYAKDRVQEKIRASTEQTFYVMNVTR